MGGHPSKSRYSKDLQDGPQIMALGNGPKQDWACWKILTPRPEGFVQFYLGTWSHKRGIFLHIWKASGVMQQLRADVFW